MRKNKKIALLFFSTWLLLACTNDKEKIRTAADLPIFGNRDIAFEDSEHYKKGDTIYHTVPDWKYLTQDSVLLSSAELNNKIWIVNFFFSYCPTICVPMNKELNEITKTLSDGDKELTFLSFSVDPQRDTPSRLKYYRNKLEFNAPNWYFLTGDRDDIYDLAYYGFQLLALEDKDAPGGFIHSSNFILVDKEKRIRGVYDSSNPENCQQLVEDVKLLLGK